MVAGVVVGISLAVLIVILIIWLVFRKKEKKKYEEEETPNEIRYFPPMLPTPKEASSWTTFQSVQKQQAPPGALM